MSEVITKRLMTDDTGQEIVGALEDLALAVKPTGAEIDMSSTDTTKVKDAIETNSQAIANIATTETISNCNTYNKQAVGRITDSTANRPFNYGVLQNVIYSTNGYRAQFAIAVTSDTYAFRRSSDGGTTWSSWHVLALRDDISILNINQSATSNRGTVTGQLLYSELECTVNLVFTSSATATNSPGILGISSYKPKQDSALSCIDITSGITSAITASVPCGIGTSGSIFIKEITNGHIYAVTGTYIREN